VSVESSDPLARLGVSRETYAALEGLEALVNRWNPAINLVGRSTVKEIWPRHILDSAQLFELSGEGSRHWVDLGSGGGFPGLVIAIIAHELRPEMRVTLVESDARKATFLREACRTLQLSSFVAHDRIQSLAPQHADVLSARALAPLSGLLAFAERHLSKDGVALFPKGVRRDDEVKEARAAWDFELEAVASLSDPTAAILMIRKVKRADSR
jgi:16S rRNA (guanine527-N7)-methyltransferase